MPYRFLWMLLLINAAAFVSAEPRTVSGSTQGPVVAVVTGEKGALNRLHEGAVLRGWVFSGPFTCAVILAGPLDTLEWDADAVDVLPGGDDAPAIARRALEASASPRRVLVNADTASQVVKTVAGEEEMDYDAASAATEE